MADLSKAEKKALAKTWKEAKRKAYMLTEEKVKELFEYLEEKLDDTGCDHTLHHTEQWLKDNVPEEIVEKTITEMTDMGGYCDCEVLLNCYEEYDIG